jgi:hypothetical protein
MTEFCIRRAPAAFLAMRRGETFDEQDFCGGCWLVLINQCFGQRVIKFWGFSSGNHIY